MGLGKTLQVIALSLSDGEMIAEAVARFVANCDDTAKQGLTLFFLQLCGASHRVWKRRLGRQSEEERRQKFEFGGWNELGRHVGACYAHRLSLECAVQLGEWDGMAIFAGRNEREFELNATFRFLPHLERRARKSSNTPIRAKSSFSFTSA